MEIKLKIDKEANAAYIELKKIIPGEVNQTIALSESINIDVDKNGKTLGIEIVDATKNLSIDTLNAAMKN